MEFLVEHVSTNFPHYLHVDCTCSGVPAGYVLLVLCFYVPVVPGPVFHATHALLHLYSLYTHVPRVE